MEQSTTGNNDSKSLVFCPALYHSDAAVGNFEVMEANVSHLALFTHHVLSLSAP